MANEAKKSRGRKPTLTDEERAQHKKARIKIDYEKRKATGFASVYKWRQEHPDKVAEIKARSKELRHELCVNLKDKDKKQKVIDAAAQKQMTISEFVIEAIRNYYGIDI